MHILKTTRLWLMLAATLLSLFSLSACKHADSTTEYGELTIELTDAEGDFSNYSVDVLSITLTKMDNTVVEVLPETTRVDFSQYVEMSELLSSANVPSGIYTAATLMLDYNNAEIYVENADGDNVPVTIFVDENNQIITTLTSTIVLDERNRLRIAPGIPAHLSIDFDLKTSNVVNFDDPASPVLTVSPVLNASLEPDMDKAHRVRGPLKQVNIDENNFDLIIRPFHKHMRGPQETVASRANQRENNRPARIAEMRNGNTPAIEERREPSSRSEKFGSLRININDETTFEIDAESFAGTDGLRAMNELEQFTAVIAFGDVSLNPRRFQATEVYAGSSVPGGDLDVVKGTVLSRTGNTLIVKGATLIRSGGSIIFNDEVTVMLDDTTMVKKQRDRSDYTISDISVGQRITVLGKLNDDTANPVLDASSGMVRLLITSISGTVVEESMVTNIDESNAAKPFFTLSLKNINRRPIALFDFEGTGTDASTDADPRNYEVDTSTLSLTQFPADTSVSLRGFVSSFGSSPADFIATSISNKKHAGRARMHTDWIPASSTAFSELSAEKITLDFSEAGRFHHVGQGQKRIDLADQYTNQGIAFSLVPTEDGVAVRYVIQVNDSRRVHTAFANLSNDLIDLIANGNTAKHIKAAGIYDKNTGEFTAKKIKIIMQ